MDDAGHQLKLQRYLQPDEKILRTGGGPDPYDIPDVAKVDRLVNQARRGSADPGQ